MFKVAVIEQQDTGQGMPMIAKIEAGVQETSREIMVEPFSQTGKRVVLRETLLF